MFAMGVFLSMQLMKDACVRRCVLWLNDFARCCVCKKKKHTHTSVIYLFFGYVLQSLALSKDPHTVYLELTNGVTIDKLS